MRFQVPQFIEVEDKIFGPLTIKQFVYIAGSAGLAFIIYHFLPLILAIPLMLPVLGFGAALAFLKVNKKPLIMTVEAALKYFIGAKLYVWRKEPKMRTPDQIEKEKSGEGAVYVPKLSDSRLKDLTWSLDVNEHLGPGVEETRKMGPSR